MSIDQKTIDELKARHGDDLHLLEHDEREVVVKRPDRPTWKRFRAMTADDKRRTEAVEQLLRDCCVHPEPTGLDTLLQSRPGLVETFGGKLAELAGATGEATSRKL